MKKTNNQLYLILPFLIIFLTSFASMCFARQLETPFLGLTDTSDIAEYIGTIARFGFGLAGGLAVLGFVLGAIRYITSAENPEARNDAIDRMKKAILGAVLILGSVVIMNTINPNLVKIELDEIPGGIGLFLTKGGVDLKDSQSVNYTVADTTALGDYKNLQYICNEGADPEKSTIYFVWQYANKNFEYSTGASLQEIKCGGSLSITGLSYRIAAKTDGVYLYTAGGCSGFASSVMRPGESPVGAPFDSTLGSVKIINTAGKPNLGFILYASADPTQRQKCSEPKISNGSDICFPADFAAKAILVFNPNPNPSTSGDGVDFSSKPFTEATGQINAGSVSLSPGKIGSQYRVTSQNQLDTDLKFSFPASVPQGEVALCPNFRTCPGSMKIKGDYLTILYAQNGQEQAQGIFNCLVFTSNSVEATNLNAVSLFNRVDGRTLKKVIITPFR